MESKYQTFLGIIIQFIIRWYVTKGQVLLKELQSYKIDPLNLNGTEPYTELTIDQIIMRAMGGIGMAQNLMLGDDGTILAELDMRLTQDQFFTLYEQPSSQENPAPPIRGKRRVQKRKKRKAIRDNILRWPNGIVPYRFVTNHFKEKEEYMIRVAMTEWEKYTCVRFRPSTRADRNVVRFQNGQGCNSQLGMVGGEQPLNLDDNGCRFKGLYLHEIGHALGLVHEHQLPNRDEYIRIIYQNVQPNMRIWFNKYSSEEVDQMKVPYEYSSVMHYGITAFSSDGKSQTIEALEKDKEDTIGRVYRKELSFTDVKIVNLMYNCAANCSKSIVCKDGGFVDQNCKCICPDGTDSCTGADTHSRDPTCFNAHDNWQCLVWANQGECDRNPKFMLDGCKKACKLCGEEDQQSDTHITTWAWQWLCVYTNVCPKKWTIDTCNDLYETNKCERWKQNGDCIVNKKWMDKHCKRTCKACKNSDTSSETSCPNKHTNLAECEKWAAEGECQINSRWMPKNCQKSCHLCDKDVEKPTETPDTFDDDDTATCEDIHNTVECQGWANNGECQLNPDWMIPNCRKSCKKCRGDKDDGGKQECKNIWDDKQCEGWARDRECMKNSVWMNRNCHKACSKCGGDTVTDSSVNTTPRPTTTEEDSGVCVNNHRNDNECNTWARHGHCQINTWMLKHCARSCKVCKKTEMITTTPSTDTHKVTTSAKTGGTCVDDDINCSSWAEHGFCEDNPGSALVICKKSCNACSAGENSCFDKHQLCPVWKKGGQCRRNGGYMLRNCRKSCNVC